jgi:5'-nucleotidase
MRVLITNDDGIYAQGIIALEAEIARLGDVQVVAPERSRSAIGHAITLHKPLRMERHYHSGYTVPAYATNGTPADAVMLGYYEIFESELDLVISGINSGPNLGEDVTYSGTVSAAMEAAVIGVPSIAVSMGNFEPVNYAECAKFIAVLAEYLHEADVPKTTLLNVNYPDVPLDKIKGIRMTRLGHRWYNDVVNKRTDPRGTDYYWICGEKQYTENPVGTDCRAIEENEISITPLTMDLTHKAQVEEWSDWSGNLKKMIGKD